MNQQEVNYKQKRHIDISGNGYIRIEKGNRIKPNTSRNL